MNKLGLLVLCLPSLLNCNLNKPLVLIYSTGESDRISFVQDNLNKKFPQYDIVIQEITTGELVFKLKFEKFDTECDIIHELEITNMETLLKEEKDLFYPLTDYDFDKFTNQVLPYNHKKYAPQCMTYCCLIYNKRVLDKKGLQPPKTYEDLLNPQYKNLISMPNPKSSGTGYAFLNGLIAEKGEDEAFNYFNLLNNNIKEYTTSGSAPIKSVDRGDVAIGFAMLWQSVQYKQNNSDLEWTPLDYGCPYNLYDQAIINGHEKRQCVKEVFDYIYDELNQKDLENFIPDPTYKKMTPKNPDYPQNIKPMKMKGITDPEYKNKILDRWKI